MSKNMKVIINNENGTEVQDDPKGLAQRKLPTEGVEKSKKEDFLVPTTIDKDPSTKLTEGTDLKQEDKYWKIELFVCRDRVGGFNYKARFTSKQAINLSNGVTVNPVVVIDEADLEDKQKQIRKSLRKNGVIDDTIFKCIIDTVKILKESGNYVFIEDEETLLSDNVNSDIKVISKELYHLLIEEIYKDPSCIAKYGYKFTPGIHDGAHEIHYKEIGYPAIIMEGDVLKHLFNISGKTEFETIMRSWRDSGILLSYNKIQKRMTDRYTFCTRHRVPAYIIKIDKELSDFLLEHASEGDE
jgi:hypothetical protein